MKLELEYDKQDREYYLSDSEKNREIVFSGSYTQCLIILGAIGMGRNMKDAIILAKSIPHLMRVI